MDQGAAQTELLPHATRQLVRRPVSERREPGGVDQLGAASLPLVAGLPEQPTEERDVLPHAEIGVEVLAESLRHIGNARAHSGPVCRVPHVAVEDVHLAGLDLPGAGDDAQER